MNRTTIVRKRVEVGLPEGYELFRLSYRAGNLWRLEKFGVPLRDFTSKIDAIAYAMEHSTGKPKVYDTPKEDDAAVVAALRSHREAARR